jgi:hypothetical protein
MKARKLITAALLVFVAASVAALVVGETRRGKQAAATTQFVVYYFYPTKRCVSCRKIEAMAREVILNDFRDAVKDKRLSWQTLNYEAPGNEHFVDDFKIAASTVVIAEQRGGKAARYKNLEQVWDYLDDEAAFTKFVREAVGGFLKESPAGT